MNDTLFSGLVYTSDLNRFKTVLNDHGYSGEIYSIWSQIELEFAALVRPLTEGWSGILNKNLSNSDLNDSRGFLTLNICFSEKGSLLYKVGALYKKEWSLRFFTILLSLAFLMGIWQDIPVLGLKANFMPGFGTMPWMHLKQ